jgi:hypothetical protein
MGCPGTSSTGLSCMYIGHPEGSWREGKEGCCLASLRGRQRESQGPEDEGATLEGAATLHPDIADTGHCVGPPHGSLLWPAGLSGRLCRPSWAPRVVLPFVQSLNWGRISHCSAWGVAWASAPPTRPVLPCRRRWCGTLRLNCLFGTVGPHLGPSTSRVHVLDPWAQVCREQMPEWGEQVDGRPGCLTMASVVFFQVVLTRGVAASPASILPLVQRDRVILEVRL